MVSWRICSAFFKLSATYIFFSVETFIITQSYDLWSECWIMTRPSNGLQISSDYFGAKLFWDVTITNYLASVKCWSGEYFMVSELILIPIDSLTCLTHRFTTLLFSSSPWPSSYFSSVRQSVGRCTSLSQRIDSELAVDGRCSYHPCPCPSAVF
jgi:hypothetical protein